MLCNNPLEKEKLEPLNYTLSRLQCVSLSATSTHCRMVNSKLKILCEENTKLVINVFIQNGAVLIFHNKSHTQKKYICMYKYIAHKYTNKNSPNDFITFFLQPSF